MREHSTVRRQPNLQGAASQGGALPDIDPHDDDLFADGDVRRRERLLSIGTVKPEPRDRDLPRFVRGAATAHVPFAKPSEQTSAAPAADAAPRRATWQAWLFGVLGFICGIGFWHAVGFWGFISAIVLPPQRPAQIATSSDAASAAAAPTAPGYQPARPTRTKP